MLKGGRIEAVADHVRNIASALEALKRLQAELWNANPELEFHYDGTRPDSEYMRVYRRHLRRAAEYEAAGDKRRALRQLESALQMELPPLPHEVVTKEIARIASDAG